MVIIVLVIWFACAVWAGTIARKKGRSFGLWLVIGFLIGLFGVLLAWAVPASKAGMVARNIDAGLTQCAACKSWIPVDAHRCAHCGEPQGVWAEVKGVAS